MSTTPNNKTIIQLGNQSAVSTTADDLFVVWDTATGETRQVSLSIMTSFIETVVQSNTDLDDLNNVTVASATTDQLLKYNGAQWVPTDLSATGAIILTDLGAQTAAASGLGSLTYDSSTGTFTMVPPDLTVKQDVLTGVSDVPGLVAALAAKQATLTGSGDVPGLTAELAAKQDNLTGISDVPGLQTEIDTKQDTLVDSGDVPGLTAELAAKQDNITGISDVPGLQTEIDTKQDTLTGSGDVPGLTAELAAKQDDLTGIADVPGLVTELATKQDNLTGISDVPGLQTEIDTKQDTLTGSGDVPGLTAELAAKQDDLTGISDVPGLVTELATKQDNLTGVSDVPGLQTDLDAKQDTLADSGDVPGLTAELALKADLVGGKVPTSQMPDIAISEFLGSVASQAAQTALSGQVGDWCIRSDEGKTYIITANTGSSYSDWTQIASPSAPVDSVNGQVGVVVLGHGDVGAAPAVHTHVLADVTDSGTAAALDVAATGDAAAGEVVVGGDSRLTDARTPVSHTHVAAEVTDFDAAADARIAAASISDVSDVDVTGVSTGDSLVWDGSAWIPADRADLDDITVTTDAASAGGTLSYNSATGAFTFAPADMAAKQDVLTGSADVPGLTAELAAKQDNITGISDVPGLQTEIDTKQDILTGISDVPGLQTEIDTKQDIITGISDTPGLQAALDAKSDDGHTHTLADITDSGSAAAVDIAGVGVDATGAQAVRGDDTRLSDARTPVAHTHVAADITDAGSAIIVDAAGVGVDATAAELVRGGDTRLTDARTPVAHTHVVADVTDFAAESVAVADARIALANIEDLANVDTSGLTNGQVLKWSGTAWTPVDEMGGISAIELDDISVTTIGTPGTAAATLTYDNTTGLFSFTPADMDDKSDVGHTHTLSDITDSGTAAPLDVAASGDATSGQVVKGDDSRLSDARTPVSHTHVAAEVTDFDAAADARIAAASVGDMSDVDLSSVAAGATVKWNGTAFETVDLFEAADITITTLPAGTGALTWNSTSSQFNYQPVDISGKSDVGHTHVVADVTDYETATDARADARIAAASIDDVTDVDISTAAPTSGQVLSWDGSAFTPATPTELGDISVTTQAAGTNALTFDDATGVLDFTPTDLSGKSDVGHTHVLADVTDAGTVAGLDVAASGDAASGEVVKGDDTRLTDARTPVSHTHVLADVTDAGSSAGLDVAASGDAASGEVVKGDDTRLTDARTPVSHTHAQSEVTNLVTDLAAKADLVAGKVPTSQLPDIAISEFLGSVASQAAQTGLTGEVGDWCIRTDESKTYIISANNGSSYSDWTQIATPSAPVDSVNGQVGVVVLGPTDVGAAAASHTHVLADVTDAGTAASFDAPASGDAGSGELVKGDDSRLSDARTPVAHTHVLADVTDSGTAAALDVAASGDAGSGEVVKGDDSRLTDARTPVSHTHTASEVTDFVAEAQSAADTQIAAASIGDMADVDTTPAATTGQALVWNGSEWAPADASDPDAITLGDLSAATAAAGTPGLSYNSSTGLFTYTPTDISGKSDVGHSHVAADITDFSSEFDTLFAAKALDALVDVNVPSPTSGQVLAWDGSQWTDVPAADPNAIVLGDISVVSATASAGGSLAYNSSTGAFTFAPADMATKSDVGHTHVLADVTDAGTSASLDVAASGDAASGEVVKGDDTRLTDARTPVAHTHVVADVTDFNTEVDTRADARIAAAQIGDLTNVDTTTAAPTSGQQLAWSGTAFVPVDAASADAIELGDLSVTNAAAAATSQLAYDDTTGAFTFTPIDISGKANVGHTHTLSDVIDAGTAAELDAPASGDAASGEVVKGDDTRLTDARTPTAHTHVLADVTDAGTSAGLDVAASGDAAAGEVVKGDDSRMTDARTPVAHTHTHTDITDFDTEAAAIADTQIGAASIGDVSDVIISGVADGDVLKWSNTTSRFEPAADAEGIALDDLSITTALASGGGTLSYDDSTGVFGFAPADMASKAAVSHTHVLADVTDAGTGAALDIPASGDAATGELVKGDDTRLTDARTPVAHTHVKADITDFDDADYAAASHTHVKADITDFDEADYAAASHTHVKADITDFDEADYAAASHTHGIADLTDFDFAMATGEDGFIATYNHTTGKIEATDPSTIALSSFDDDLDYAAAVHTHAISDVTGLQTALDAKAATSHTHTLSEITDSGTAAALDVPSSGDAANSEVVKGDDSRLTDARTPVSHTHVVADITDFDPADKADLVAGKVPTSQLPAIAISEFLGTAANETAQLALTGQEGDWCIRTDEGLTYIITTGTGSSYSDWQEIVTPDAPVTSVNGNTGVVVLGPSDVGAAAASHTHVLADVTDAGTSAGLDVPASGDAAAGEVVKGTDTRLTDARTPVAHTHVIADTTGLQTALDGKAATSHTHVKADITDFDEADYAAASHTHVKADITDFDEADYAAASHTHVKADITDFDDADYAAASHTHTLSEVTDAGTAAALDVPASGDAASGEVVKGTDTRLTDARTPTAHTHVKADITDFDEADYAAASHTHVIADTTGLQTALDGKAATSHTHVKADITDFDDADYAAVSHTHTASEVTDFSTAADARIAAADLSDLGDVHPSAATTGQVLAWNGTAWAPADDDGGIDLTDLAVTTATASGAGALSYNSSTGDFTFTPADGTQYAAASHTHTHDDITDFDTEVDARIGVATLDDLDGVSVGSPTNGQSLVYDNSTGQWVPGAAGIGAHTHTHDDITDFDNEVNSLADARITAANLGDLANVGSAVDSTPGARVLMVRDNTGDWTTAAATLENAAIQDVDLTSPADNDILQYNTSTGKWENAALSGQVGASSMADLSNATSATDDTTVSSAQYLYKPSGGSDWQPVEPALSHLTGDVDLTGLADGEALIYSTSSGKFEPGAVATDITSSSIDDLSDVDTTTSAPTDGQALVWNNTDSEWQPATVAGSVSDIDDLSDVDTSTAAPTDGQALVWNNSDSEWQPGDVSATLDGLTDVDLTTNAPSDGQGLIYDSANSEWVASDIIAAGSASVSLPSGKCQWGSDTVLVAQNNNCNLFNSNSFPNASISSGQPLTSAFTFSASSGTYGFVAPEDGTYQLTLSGSVGWSSGTQQIRAYGNWQKNNVSLVAETLYNYDDIGTSNLYPMADMTTVVLSKGDRMSYQISAASGSGTLSVRYWTVDVTQLTFDAALVADQAITTDIAKFSTTLHTERRAGTTAEGKPLYEYLDRFAGGFSTGVTITMFDLTGKTLVDTEWVRLYDGAGQIAYTGDASAGLFGFIPYVDGTDLKVIRTTNAPITSGFTGTPSGEGHSGQLRIFYTKDADSTDVASVIVPQDSLIEPPTGGANDGDTLVWNGTSAEWERREPYYLETAAQDQTSSMNGNGGGSRIFNRSSNFSNTQSFNISYGEASSSDWESSFGNWTAPSAGLYKFTVQFGLDAGEDASVRARLYTDSGSGFSARGNSFHVRGSTGEQLYMTNFTIARSFETGDRARIYFEENGGSGASNVDIENAAVIIERIGY